MNISNSGDGFVYLLDLNEGRSPISQVQEAVVELLAGSRRIRVCRSGTGDPSASLRASANSGCLRGSFASAQDGCERRPTGIDRVLAGYAGVLGDLTDFWAKKGCIFAGVRIE
ncbi:MAG: hypothetical protein ACYS74_04950 [Planctomycetota bacterium]|jgi:hypothetical protein